MRRRRGLGSLGSTVCKPAVARDGEPPIEKCGTRKDLTLCVGDRVQRLPVKSGGKTYAFKQKGTVRGVEMGADNKGKKQVSARVCWDDADAGDTAYPYLFVELKKIK